MSVFGNWQRIFIFKLLGKYYSLIIGNVIRIGFELPIPFLSCKSRIFGDDDHSCYQDLDQPYFLTVHMFPRFKVQLYYYFNMSFE